jgi:outer membrane receptor for monomeric catechols
MVFDGHLRRSLVNRRHEMHVARWALAPSATITVGTNDIVAAYHIKGNPVSNPHVPERDTVLQTDKQNAAYLDLVRAYMIDVKLARVKRIMQRWRVARNRARNRRSR